MGKGSDRRPQLILDEVMYANWNRAFSKMYFCTNDFCGYACVNPEIAGTEPPYTNVCPVCGNRVQESA